MLAGLGACSLKPALSNSCQNTPKSTLMQGCTETSMPAYRWSAQLQTNIGAGLRWLPTAFVHQIQPTARCCEPSGNTTGGICFTQQMMTSALSAACLKLHPLKS